MSLDQIGQKLRAARESQGLSLAQINERTKIPLNHLQAIDSGNADDLPETVYVAGFIKRYADCVGLNGPSLSEEYKREASTSSNGGNGDGGGWAGRNNKSAPVMVSPAYVQRVRTEQKQPNVIRSVIFPAMWIVVLFAIITFLYQWQQTNNTSNQDTTIPNFGNYTKFNSVQPTTPGGATSAGPTTTTTTATTTAPPVSADATVSISAAKHVWVEIKAVSTGESLFTGFLEAGDQRDYKDPQGIRVHAGNGGNLTVIQDGGKPQTLGPNGKPSEKAFMAKNASSTATTPALGPDGKPLTGTGTTTTAVKPTVKKVVKRAATSDAAPKRHYQTDDSTPRRLPGEFGGGTRSIDVPYRYDSN